MLVRCKSCLMPNTRPSTPFIDGECSACVNHRAKANVNWRARALDFSTIAETYIGKNGSGYDCIVPSSGGKDSTAQVLKVISLGLRPLVVTATTCHLTEIGRKNIDNLSQYATTIEYTPNRVVRAKMNRIGLEMVGDISLPEHMAIFSIPFRVAADLGIPLIVYGECPTNEYGGPVGSEKHTEITRRYINEHQGFLGMRPTDFIGLSDITADDVRDYMLPSEEKMAKIKAVFLGQYFEWNSRQNAAEAIASGMIAKKPSPHAWWDFENLDNAQTGLHDYFGFLKYGFGRRTAQASIDIRNGVFTREELASIVDHDGIFPFIYGDVDVYEVLSRIGMSFDELLCVMKKFTNKKILTGDKFPVLQCQATS